MLDVSELIGNLHLQKLINVKHMGNVYSAAGICKGNQELLGDLLKAFNVTSLLFCPGGCLLSLPRLGFSGFTAISASARSREHQVTQLDACNRARK